MSASSGDASSRGLLDPAASPRLPRTHGRTPILDALIAALSILLLAVASIGGWHWYRRQGPAPRGVSAAGGVTFGAPGAATAVDIYLDPICPGCQNLETTDGAQINRLIAGGAQVRFHVVSFLDRESPDQLSSRAANAAYCASDQDRFRPYLSALMGQISVGTPASNAKLLSVGRQVGITSGSFTSCVDRGRYRSFVRRVTAEATSRGITGVPSVFVDGRRSPLPTATERCTPSACSAAVGSSRLETLATGLRAPWTGRRDTEEIGHLTDRRRAGESVPFGPTTTRWAGRCGDVEPLDLAAGDTAWR